MLKRLFLLPILALLIGCRELPPPPAVEISIAGGDITLVNGEYQQIFYDVENFDENYPYEQHGPVVWTSSNNDVAYIRDGFIYAVGVGTSIITVTLRDKYTDSVVCTVTDAYPDTFYLHFTSAIIDINEAYQLTWRILPSYARQDITWTTSDSSVATVDSDGLVTGKKYGTAVIKGKTLSDLEAECTITVADRSPTEIVFDKEHYDIKVGEEIECPLEVFPSYANVTTYKATSSDPNIVVTTSSLVHSLVNRTGYIKIKGVAPGEATITFTVNNSISTSFTVSVTHILPESLTFDVSRVSLQIDSEYQVNYAFLPETTTERTLTWTTSEPTVASVTEDGKITALETGYTTVRATTANGIGQEIFVTVYFERNKHRKSEIEPNDTLQTAQSTYFGITITGTSANLSDKDYYKVSVHEDEKIHVDFRSDFENYSEYFSVRILDADGEFAAVVPLLDIGITNPWRVIDYDVPKGGIYYIEIMITEAAPITENVPYRLYVHTL